MSEQFRIAYDIYLDILYTVRRRVAEALGQDTPNWRALNACPTCDYRLDDELPLEFSKLVAIDGNNSLCRVNAQLTRDVISYIDTWTAHTDYWLSPEFVDQFKNEVKAKKTSPVTDGTFPGVYLVSLNSLP